MTAALLWTAMCAFSNSTSDANTQHAQRLVQARILLACGRAQDALIEARQFNREAPDDLDGYALVVDAARVTGNRSEAEQAAQWMLDLRTTDVRGLYRAAELREDLGDWQGALDLYSECYQRTPLGLPSARARILQDLARVFRKSGDVSHASALDEQARKLQ